MIRRQGRTGQDRTGQDRIVGGYRLRATYNYLPRKKHRWILYLCDIIYFNDFANRQKVFSWTRPMSKLL